MIQVSNPTFCNKPVLAESLAATRGTLTFRSTPVEKHWATVTSVGH